jgi:transglutaminase-like putative cysteine protease
LILANFQVFPFGVQENLPSAFKVKQNTAVSSVAAFRRQPMGSAERFFQRSLYLLLVMGFTALAGTGKLDFLSLVLGGSALVLRGYYLLRKRRSFVIGDRLTSYLTLAYLGFYAVDYFLLSQSFVSATVHMVLFIMVVKIFSVQRDRDLLYLAVLSFLMILAAAVLTVDTMFLLTFCLFMLTAMATFISMEMRRSERESVFVRSTPQREHRFHRSLALTAVLLAGFTMAGAVVIFFAIPRMEARGYLRNMGTQNDLVTGFSESVNLGGIGKIQQSDAVVMHVQVLHGVLPIDGKWRGAALANFDGRRWWNDQPDLAVVYPMREVPVDLRRVTLDGIPMYAASAFERSSVAYRVIMEPVGASIFFLADRPLKVNGPYSDVGISPEGSVMNESRRTIDRYEGESDMRNLIPPADILDSGVYPTSVARTYLQLPVLDPRIPELARTITSATTSNYGRARAIEAYLQRSLGYTLELPGTEADPLANFLFVRKKGHCEYFASAMAVMLRSVGIPSRIVNGFRGSQFNDLNQTYIVRARDAHSWVEAYFPNYGWLAFDPTPSLPAGSENNSWARLSLYMDAARELWREWIINYDFSHQVRLSTELGNHTSYVQHRVRWWSWKEYRHLLGRLQKLQGRDVSHREVVGLVLLAIILIFLPFAPRAWRALQRTRIIRNPRHAPRTAASFWYMRMLKLMARRGINKSPAQTAAEFASAIADPQVRKDVVTFTAHYERARFAESVEDAERLPELYEELSEKK